MTFVTFKHFQVFIVTETGIKRLESNILDIFMTFVTVTFGGKSRFPVVARTTGLARLHVKHGMADPVRPGDKNLIVTF